MVHKDSPEYRLIASLSTPTKIKDFLDSIPFNSEYDGESCMSAYRVAQTKKAHCLEAGFFAAACLWTQKRDPIVVSLKALLPDDDHIITLYTEKGLYGAISKASHPVLRHRDPIYRSVREIVMTYVHEYFLFTTGVKTMVGYTKPINLRRYGLRWITAPDDLWDIAERIYDTPVLNVIPPGVRKSLRPVSSFELAVFNALEWD